MLFTMQQLGQAQYDNAVRLIDPFWQSSAVRIRQAWTGIRTLDKRPTCMTLCGLQNFITTGCGSYQPPTLFRHQS